ncbi:MAG: Wzz/FepE/Etk N-terminal domain-containing protein [Candidatus Falkowbacteria bacterium]
MDTKEFIKLAKKRKMTVISITLIFVIIGLIVTLAQPLKYRSKSRLLILQPDTAADAYAVARSNQYVGGLISEVIYSGSFLDSLNSSSYVFNRNYFNGTYKQNIKEWKKTVFAKSGGDTGVIDIEIYHTDPEEARKISLAVNQLIISGQSPYKFNANQTKISVIDEPVVSSFPVKPNIILNLGLGLLFGFLSGCSYIYLFPKERLSEKMAKELFGQERVSQAPNFKVAEPAFMPETTVSNYQPEMVPVNLPIYSQETEELPHIISEVAEIPQPSFKTSFNFKGNISNVLGE